MALEAGQMGGVEDERAAAGVAAGGNVREEPIPWLGEERLSEALSGGRGRRQADSHEGDHGRRNETNA
jgi:hypothetical protein